MSAKGVPFAGRGLRPTTGAGSSGQRRLEIPPEILAAMVRSPLWHPQDAVRPNGFVPETPADGNED